MTTTTGGGPPLLTDETWARLDPDAGRLSAVDRRRVLVVAVVTLVLVVSAGVVWRGGLLWPRIETQLVGYDTDDQGRTFRMVLQVDNRGAHRPAPAVGRPVGRRSTAPRHQRRPDRPAVVDRPWGSLTTYDEAPSMQAANAPATYSYQDGDPYAVPWQVYLARRACR